MAVDRCWLAARTVYVLDSRSLHLEVGFRGVIREDVDLGAIRLVKHIAFAFIGRHYDPVPRRPVVITGVQLGIQQPPVVQPHNVRRREILENRPPIAFVIRFRVRWAEGKRKKDWNEHSFHSQKHRWFILDSVPALGFEDLGAHVVEIGGNAEHTPDRLGLLLENTERHLVAFLSVASYDFGCGDHRLGVRQRTGRRRRRPAPDRGRQSRPARGGQR
jgi:hypothetical protein